MAAVLRRAPVRLGVLLAILCTLIAVAVARPLWGSTNADEGDLNPPQFTAAQMAAAESALLKLTPPQAFREIARWRVTKWHSGPSVACSPEPAVCFGSNVPIAPLTAKAVRGALVQSGAHIGGVICPEGDPIQLRIQHCEAVGTLGRYSLAILVVVQHAKRPDQRSGTELIFFAIPGRPGHLKLPG